jgi:hypothetical protein
VSCVDHTIHLVIEAALDAAGLDSLKAAIAKVRKQVDYFKDCHLALESLLDIQEELDMPIITPVQGTKNR